jgi:hypothetical protein
MLDALLDEGIERGYAIELIGDSCWRVYARWGQVPRLLSRMLARDPAKRMRISVDTFLRFPFNQPGYRYREVAEPAGRGLDMLRCPAADYLAAHSASDLAVGSWCNLDFQLARMWGGTLERHNSLAQGARCCDFRFRAARGAFWVPRGATPLSAAAAERQRTGSHGHDRVDHTGLQPADSVPAPIRPRGGDARPPGRPPTSSRFVVGYQRQVDPGSTVLHARRVVGGRSWPHAQGMICIDCSGACCHDRWFSPSRYSWRSIAAAS